MMTSSKALVNRDDDRIVRASEVGLYTYCARAWWLGQVEGHRPVNQQAMEVGEAAHQAHGRAVAGYHRLRQAAYALLGLALLVGLVLLVTMVLK
jgi:CRISPR/Cas system-associated exonuclease Cas4 (RecB family)